MTSPKDGCSPSGQCGCCTVLIDGKASVSCQISLEKVAGKSITTLEGFDATERERFAAAFAAAGALQCGFCTPGVLGPGQGTNRQEGLGSYPRRGCSLSRSASVPVHRLQQDPRSGGGVGNRRITSGDPAWGPRDPRHQVRGHRARSRRPRLRGRHQDSGHASRSAPACRLRQGRRAQDRNDCGTRRGRRHGGVHGCGRPG